MKDVKTKQVASDIKFLNRLVVTPKGVSTIKCLIEELGICHFKQDFIDGRYEYKFLNDYRIKEVYSPSQEIYDSRSGRLVSAVGALKTYWRALGVVERSSWKWSWVPGSKPSGGHMYRRVKTFSSLKAASIYWAEEGEMDFPAKTKHLPVKWDDIPIASRKDRNWKGYRKTQYK